MRSVKWQKVVTREFSYLWASYTAEVYKIMAKLTGTTLKYNLFYTRGRLLTIYRISKDIERSYRLIERLIKNNPRKAIDNLNKFEEYLKISNRLIKQIKEIDKKNKIKLRALLLKLDKNYLKIIAYYLFVVFLGYAGNLPFNKKFIKKHQKQFEKIRMSTMDVDFHEVLPTVYGLLDRRLKSHILYMSRSGLISCIKGNKVNWNNIKIRHKQGLLIVKNRRAKEYSYEEIKAVLDKELSHLNFKKDVKVLVGQVAYKGRVEGRVVKIFKRADYKKIKPGSILVTPMTKPDIIPYLKKVKGIITNDGGALCHASIIARELKIPCVVGTIYATDILKDSDLLEIDANKCIIKKQS